MVKLTNLKWIFLPLKAATLFLALCATGHAALIAVDEQSDRLLSINTVTGDYAVIGSLTVSTPSGLDFQRIRSLVDIGGTLYGTDVTGQSRLLTIDSSTAAVTVVGTLSDPADIFASFGEVGGLAYDNVSGILYGVDEDTTNNQLLRIDPATAVASQVGLTGNPDLRSLAFAGGNLYSVDSLASQLFRIDPLTGAGSLVGDLFPGEPPNLSKVEALTYDALSGNLLGFDSIGDSVLSISLLTGAATRLVDLDKPVGDNPQISGIVGSLDQAPAVVPVPPAILLFASALAGLFGLRRRVGA